MKTNAEVQISCKRCRGKVSIKQMKYDINARDLICPACYEKQHAKEPQTLQTTLQTIKDAAARVVESQPEAKYICSNCHYTFMRSKNFNGSKTCPYCAKWSIFQITSQHASDIIKGKFLAHA